MSVNHICPRMWQTQFRLGAIERGHDRRAMRSVSMRLRSGDRRFPLQDTSCRLRTIYRRGSLQLDLLPLKDFWSPMGKTNRRRSRIRLSRKRLLGRRHFSLQSVRDRLWSINLRHHHFSLQNLRDRLWSINRRRNQRLWLRRRCSSLRLNGRKSVILLRHLFSRRQVRRLSHL